MLHPALNRAAARTFSRGPSALVTALRSASVGGRGRYYLTWSRGRRWFEAATVAGAMRYTLTTATGLNPRARR